MIQQRRKFLFRHRVIVSDIVHVEEKMNLVVNRSSESKKRREKDENQQLKKNQEDYSKEKIE